MQLNEKISVIVPIYNNAAFLERCIKSIQNQTYSSIEIIAINDGSTDNSLDILRDMSKSDNRIIVIDQENKGVSSARNRGIECAKGEYITFVDSDDEIAPHMYETLYRLIKDYNCDIAHCGYKKIFPDGQYKDVMGTEQIISQSSEEAIASLIKGQYFTGSLWNKLIKRNLFLNNRFDENIKINEDVLLTFKLFKESTRIVFHDSPLYFFYENPKSSSRNTQMLKKCKDGLFVAKTIFDLCKNTTLSEIASNYYFNSLMLMYRLYVFEDFSNSSNERKGIINIAKNLKQNYTTISAKQKINYYALYRFPLLYRFLYRFYDKIRVPNWDVKHEK